MCIKQKHKLTVCVFERLLLFGGLRDDFDPLAEEDTDVSAVAIEHLDGQHEVLSLVGVGYVQGFGCAIILEMGKKEIVSFLPYMNNSREIWHFDKVTMAIRFMFGCHTHLSL